MEKPNLPAIRALRPAWNIGRILGQKRSLKPKHIWAIGVLLEIAENHRDLALFNMTVDSKLRGCDLARMKVVDVVASGRIKERASVLQRKFQVSSDLRHLARHRHDPGNRQSPTNQQAPHAIIQVFMRGPTALTSDRPARLGTAH